MAGTVGLGACALFSCGTFRGPLFFPCYPQLLGMVVRTFHIWAHFILQIHLLLLPLTPHTPVPVTLALPVVSTYAPHTVSLALCFLLLILRSWAQIPLLYGLPPPNFVLITFLSGPVTGPVTLSSPLSFCFPIYTGSSPRPPPVLILP